MFQTIIFAVDSSLEARQAVPIVVELVRKYQSRLVLLSVLNTEDPDSDRAKSESLLENARQLFEAENITVETKLAEGKPAFVICDVADELNGNLIVMGTRGMSPIETSESVSQLVISLSPCPVLVVP